MKDNYSYSIQLRCVVCGSEDHFDYNKDKSYIKCTNCGKEYFGGYDELVACNQDQIEEVILATADDTTKLNIVRIIIFHRLIVLHSLHF